VSSELRYNFGGEKILRSLYDGNYRMLSCHVVISKWEGFYITANVMTPLTTCCELAIYHSKYDIMIMLVFLW